MSLYFLPTYLNLDIARFVLPFLVGEPCPLIDDIYLLCLLVIKMLGLEMVNLSYAPRVLKFLSVPYGRAPIPPSPGIVSFSCETGVMTS